MPKMVCVKCEIELKPEKNGVIVKEMFQDNTAIYKLWEADKLKCPRCDIEIVAGFAPEPFALHFTHDCQALIQKAIDCGREIVCDYER